MSVSYAANSLDGLWMPFTANRDFKADPRMVVRAEGIYYWNHHGERVLDGSSGLFCCAAGHGRGEIAQAVAAQLTALDFAPPFQFGHPAAFELARRIATHTPAGIDHVFFVNSGSEAIDTAMKIALAYHHACGQPQRQRFISRERAYHGVNLGGTALSGIVNNRKVFGPGLATVAHMRHTHLPEHRLVKGQPEIGAALADDLQRLCELYGGNTVAACFVEPIAGSIGVLVPPVGYLERLREICDQQGILLVFDEVICGFGRTGQPFAAQSFGVTPDIITMAKALTNGAQPLGAVAVRDSIYDAVTGATAVGGIEFYHGYTYSGHPAACAAGLATLDIYEREQLFTRAAELAPHFLDTVFELADIPGVTDIRGYGLLAAVDLEPLAVPGRRGLQAQKRLFAAGLYLKMTGDTAIIAPPLTATRTDIEELCGTLRQVLESG
jgi:beta-alanine--pyruvate transaminase